MTKISSSPRTVRLVSALVLLATFAAGTVTGGGLVHWFASDSDSSRHVMPPMLPLGELNLSEAQDKKVRDILERYRPKLEALLDEAFPKARAVNEQIEREVRGVLTDEQRRILDRVRTLRRSPYHGGPLHDGPPLPPPLGGPRDWPPGEVRAVPPPGPPPEAQPGPLSSGSVK